MVRWREWWFYKIPVCFLLFAIGSHEPLTWHTFARLVALVLIVSAVANYGHAINDLFDRREDEKGNKPNVATQFGIVTIGGVAIVSAALAVILSYWFFGVAGGTLTASALVLPALYSIPPVRLKERRSWGLVADAGAAHVYPAVFSISMLSSGVFSRSEATFLAIVSLWSFLTGLRNIILHQLSTEGRDRQSGLPTIVHDLAVDRVARLVLTILAFEVISLFVVIALSEANVVFLLMTAFYVLKEAAQYALEMKRVSFNPTELVCPFINNAYYLVWAPVAALASLAVQDPPYALLILGFAILFWRNLLSEWIDLKRTGSILQIASGGVRDMHRLMAAVEKLDRRLVEADRDLHRLIEEVEERDRRLVEADRDLHRLIEEVEERDRRLVRD